MLTDVDIQADYCKCDWITNCFEAFGKELLTLTRKYYIGSI